MAARKQIVRLETGRVWRPEDVAARWGCLPSTVEMMCREGRVPGAFKVGRQWRLTEEALVAYERGGGFGSRPFEVRSDA